MIEITKPCAVAFMKVRNCLVVRCREKHVSWEKKDGKKYVFKALAKRFCLTLKSCSWFNKVVHG